MIGKTGDGPLHAFPLKDEHYALYERVGFIFVQGAGAPSSPPNPSDADKEFVLVRIGHTTKVCETDTYQSWKERHAAGQATHENLYGRTVLVHPEPLPETSTGETQKWVFFALAQPPESDALADFLWHFGYAGNVEVIQN